MPNIIKLTESSTSIQPITAELFSSNSDQRFAITILGYQFPTIRNDSNDNWYKVLVEYNSGPHFLIQFTTHRFDADSFGKSSQAFNHPSPRLFHNTVILEPPYRESPSLKLEIQSMPISPRFQKPRRSGKRFPRFPRNYSGFSVIIKLNEYPTIEFKLDTNRVLLKKFTDGLKKICKEYPKRYIEPKVDGLC